jgi:YHS domain-containing protein
MKTTTVDLVCGMNVDETTALHTEYEGASYYFCSERCRQTFRRNPEEFIARANEHDESDSAAGFGSGGSEKTQQKGRGAKWTDYIPLMVIVALTLLAASAKQFAYPGGWVVMTWMHDFMGFFLVVFSMFKFFNMEGFADGFQMYDLFAKQFRTYAYVYPFIELGLGLGYLCFWQPAVVYWVTIGVMIFGSLGVFNALRKGLDLECACMGTVLKVPLSTVALVEDLGMAAMAAFMLFMAGETPRAF